MHRLSFRTQVLCLSLIASILPLILTTIINLNKATELVREQNKQLLIAMRDNKKNQLIRIASSTKDSLLAAADVITNLKIDLQNETSHSLLKKLNAELGFYDIFVVSQGGDVVYTVTREDDYLTNLNSGPYKNTGLAEVFRKAKAVKGKISIVDFSPYAPSNNEPAAFIAVSRIINGGEWVIAAQISTDDINQLMKNRAGMGKTGETYLVGSDFRMRSDSVLDPINYSIRASFAGSIERNGVTSIAAKAALSGQTGEAVVIDDSGNNVLSAFTPVDFLGLKWALLSEIDESELNEPINTLVLQNLLLLLVAILLSVCIALYLAKTVMLPLGGEPAHMKELVQRLARGDLTFDLTDAAPTSLKGALNMLNTELRSILREITERAEQLVKTSSNMGDVTSKTDASLATQSIELDSIVTAVNEMTVSIQDVAQRGADVASQIINAGRVTQEGLSELQLTEDITLDLENQVKHSHEIIVNLSERINDITSILDVIRGVADQTNLLALNAAIEAARAGESGRGFAVVADEVRNLAKRTQESTQQIEKVISEIVSQSNESVNQIDLSINATLNARSSLIDVANRIREISVITSSVSDQVVTVSAATEQQASVALAIDKSLVNLQQVAQQTKSASKDTTSSSNQVSQVAENLRSIVSRFKLTKSG